MATVLPNRITWLRRGALAAGVVAAATLVAIGRLPAGGGVLGLDVKVTSAPTGELAVAPAGTVATAAGLQPGEGELRGRVTLQSEASKPLDVHVRQLPSMTDADRSLRVRLSSAGRVVYDGTAGGLRSASKGSVRIASHGAAPLDIRAWIPPDADGGWTGRSITLPLEFVVDVHGKRRR
jgi:hypothetical protein